jgi:hypothetical protein
MWGLFKSKTLQSVQKVQHNVHKSYLALSLKDGGTAQTIYWMGFHHHRVGARESTSVIVTALEHCGKVGFYPLQDGTFLNIDQVKSFKVVTEDHFVDEQ